MSVLSVHLDGGGGPGQLSPEEPQCLMGMPAVLREESAPQVGFRQQETWLRGAEFPRTSGIWGTQGDHLNKHVGAKG